MSGVLLEKKRTVVGNINFHARRQTASILAEHTIEILMK